MKDGSPLFSIVTVVRNGEDFIEKTLKSVIGQTYKNVEVIVIDGGSTDSTVELLKKYGKSISHWVSEPDEGIYHAMNKGIRLCNGDYIFFLNCGDCLASPYVLDEVAKYIQTNSPDILHGDIYINSEGSKTPLRMEIESDFQLYKKTICHQAIFSSSRVFEVVGGFDTSYRVCADREWLIRALRKYKFRLSYINVPISVFDRSGVSSRTRTLQRFEDMKINFVYFGSKFYPYLLKQIQYKIRHMMNG
jgi:glycosyltransferase involved in cell wall biosynthesis